jgi:hypothetical protein
VSTPTLAERVMAGTFSSWQKEQAIASLRKTIKRAKKGLSQRERKLKRLTDSLLPSSLDREPQRLDFGFPGDKEEIQAIKVVAERLTEARKLCGHTIGQAAQLLSIAPDDLKAIENTTGVYRVPLWLVRSAAELYLVPVDFLLSLIDEFDAGDHEAFKGRDLLAALQRQQLEDFTKNANEQIRQDGKLTAMNSAVAASVMAVQQIVEAFTRFTQLNPHFENMRGGAPVLRQIQIAEELATHATSVLTHYKALPESLKAHGEYMLKTFPTQNGYFSD